MKKLFLILLTGLSCFIIHAQKSKDKDTEITAFGKVAKADLEMKECDFDKKAEAMVLFEKGDLSCIIGSIVTIELEMHVRIKILTDKGRDHADIKLTYHSYANDEEIKDISAQTFNLDASGNIIITKVDKKLIYEKKLNKRFTQKIFTFPEVKAGSIIEYKYKLTGAGLVNWYFQSSIPVKYSQFSLDFPRELELSSRPMCSMDFEKKFSETSTRYVQFFAMKDVPALRDEPFILNEDDYRERIESRIVAINVSGRRQSLTRTWPSVIKSLLEDEDFGLQLKKDIPRTEELEMQLVTIKDPYEKMKIIHKYVRENMSWNGYSSIWALDGIKTAWKDKKGTTGEINLILVNLLKDAGLKVRPMLVSTHSNGLVNTMIASTNQFDKVLAYVEIGSKIYILDATEKETPAHLIPTDVLMTEGLVIEKAETFEWGWRKIWDKKLENRNTVFVQGEIDEDGKMSGVTTITSYDYARLNRISTARKGKKDFTEKYFSSLDPGISIDSIELENVESDSIPLVQKVYYNQQLNTSGDYKYFSANLFSGLEKNPFITDTRFSDVFFGVNQYYSIIGNFALPETEEFDELPKNIKMIMPDTSISITRLAQVANNRLTLKITLEFKKPIFSIEEYPDFKEFYKKMQDILNEQFVLKKKARP